MSDAFAESSYTGGLAANENRRPSNVSIAPNDEVLVHGLKGPKKYLNNTVMVVNRYDEDRQRYILSDYGDITRKDVGAFKQDNLRVVNFVEHKLEKVKILASLYDPKGPHPLEKYQTSDSTVSMLMISLRMFCPDIQYCGVDSACLSCGKTSDIMYCSRCKVTPFCSTSCQKLCFKEHKVHCTTREQRIDTLRNKLRIALPSESPSFYDNDDTLAILLDVSGDFVDGAYIIAMACYSQSLSGDDWSQADAIACVEELCRIRLEPGVISHIAEAMGIGENVEMCRKAWLARFQQRERAMEKPRKLVLSAWARLRESVVSLGPFGRYRVGSCLQLATGNDAPHADILDLCDFLAEQCEQVRCDEGRSVTWFLLLLGELTRCANANPHHKVPTKHRVAKAEMEEAWVEIIGALKGKSFLANIPRNGTNASARFQSNELYGTIYEELERLHMRGEGESKRLCMDQMDVDAWLSSDKGRWLPAHYSIGDGIRMCVPSWRMDLTS